jgi:hypothetical protein
MASDRKYGLFGDWSRGYSSPEIHLSEINMILTYGQFARDAAKSRPVALTLHNDPIHIVDKNFTKGLIEFSFFGSVMTALRMEELIESGGQGIRNCWVGRRNPIGFACRRHSRM